MSDSNIESLCEKRKAMSKCPERPNDNDDETTLYDGDCRWCGGSGGGNGFFACPHCRGTGRSASHRQEQLDHEAEIRRDMAVDDQLMSEMEKEG